MLEVVRGLLVEPLMQIYAMLFAALPEPLGVGSRIVLFGIALNLLLIPLYQQMESRSRGTRALRQRVEQDVQRMRQHFKGRELYFYTRAVHRQHRYSPLAHALGSADLAVQIIVFFTVFHFLAGMDALRGTSFGPLTDLSQPDRLLGGVNLLPLLMTLINVGSVFIYSQERKRRLPSLTLAVLFLVLLYNSPAGLVLYWTTNNLFSLVRNVLSRLSVGTSAAWLQQFTELREQQ